MNMNHLRQFFFAAAASLVLSVFVSPASASGTQALPGEKDEARLTTDQFRSEYTTDLSVQLGRSADSQLPELIVKTARGHQVYAGNHGPHETIVFKNGAFPTIVTKTGKNGMVVEFTRTHSGVFAQAISH